MASINISNPRWMAGETQTDVTFHQDGAEITAGFFGSLERVELAAHYALAGLGCPRAQWRQWEVRTMAGEIVPSDAILQSYPEAQFRLCKRT